MNYPINPNHSYNSEIPAISSDDYVCADTSVNPIFTQIINNVEFLKAANDALSGNLAGLDLSNLDVPVSSRAAATALTAVDGKIGVTSDTGGSQTAGTVMAKLNENQRIGSATFTEASEANRLSRAARDNAIDGRNHAVEANRLSRETRDEGRTTQGRIGVTGDTGGSQTAGTVMAKLNENQRIGSATHTEASEANRLSRAARDTAAAINNRVDTTVSSRAYQGTANHIVNQNDTIQGTVNWLDHLINVYHNFNAQRFADILWMMEVYESHDASRFAHLLHHGTAASVSVRVQRMTVTQGISGVVVHAINPVNMSRSIIFFDGMAINRFGNHVGLEEVLPYARFVNASSVEVFGSGELQIFEYL